MKKEEKNDVMMREPFSFTLEELVSTSQGIIRDLYAEGMPPPIVEMILDLAKQQNTAVLITDFNIRKGEKIKEKYKELAGGSNENKKDAF